VRNVHPYLKFDYYLCKLLHPDPEPDLCDEYWDDLDEEHQVAAAVLGYDKETWDKEDGGCCVIL